MVTDFRGNLALLTSFMNYISCSRKHESKRNYRVLKGKPQFFLSGPAIKRGWGGGKGRIKKK